MTAQRITTHALLAIGLTACMSAPLPSSVPERAAAVSHVRGARSYPTRMRPCRADRLYIDVPLMTSPAWSNLNFLAPLTAQLQTLAATGGWFCKNGVCPSESVRVVAEPLLTPNASYGPRADGHLRFARIRFEGEQSQDPYELSDEGACWAVLRTRALVENLTSAARDEFLVGRECDVTIMSLQASPTVEMLAWHTRRLGLSDSVLQVGAPSGSSTVDLAIVDTGIDSGISAAIGVSSTSNFQGTTPPSQHGTVMAILARQLAPEAAIHDLRALGAGASTSAAVTAALDHALFASIRPLVLSLSLGAPPELTRSAVLSAGTCLSYEDPFGESIRYMLDIAERLDTDGVRPVFVSAAAGNRPLEVDPTTFPPEQYPLPTCSPQTMTANEWFIPGQWHRLDSCRPPYAGTSRLAFATGAIDDRNEPSIAGIAGAEPPLVAPGQHVIVQHFAAIPTPGQCTTSPPPGVALPATLTGSSVSAALTGAAAARVQHQLLEARQPPLDRVAMGRLLYLTGFDVCRTSASGAPVRRLHVARLDTAAAQCPDLVECARSASGAEPIPTDLLAQCAAALKLCGLETLDALGNVIPQCTGPGAPVPIPAGDDGSSCVQNSGTAAAIAPAVCGASCPDAPTIDRFTVGTLGPQPPVGGCPHCKWNVAVGGANPEFVIYAEIDPYLPSSVTMTSPWLRLIGTNVSTQTTQKIYVDLTPVSAPVWHPGEYRKINVEISGSNFGQWDDVEAVLLLQISDGVKSVTDVSPLVREEQ